MLPPPFLTFTAFAGNQRIASGELLRVAALLKEILDTGGDTNFLIFDDRTGRQVELDFRGTTEDVQQRLLRVNSPDTEQPDRQAPRGPGRPKLGVVAREVT